MVAYLAIRMNYVNLLVCDAGPGVGSRGRIRLSTKHLATSASHIFQSLCWNPISSCFNSILPLWHSGSRYHQKQAFGKTNYGKMPPKSGCVVDTYFGALIVDTHAGRTDVG